MTPAVIVLLVEGPAERLRSALAGFAAVQPGRRRVDLVGAAGPATRLLQSLARGRTTAADAIPGELHVHLVPASADDGALPSLLGTTFRHAREAPGPVWAVIPAAASRLGALFTAAFEEGRRPQDRLVPLAALGERRLEAVPDAPRLVFAEAKGGRVHVAFDASPIRCRPIDARLWAAFAALRGRCRTPAAGSCACCTEAPAALTRSWARWVDPADEKGTAADLRAACARIRAALVRAGVARAEQDLFAVTGQGRRGERRYGVRAHASLIRHEGA